MDFGLKDVHVLVTGTVRPIAISVARDQPDRHMDRQVQVEGSVLRPPNFTAVSPHCARVLHHAV